MFSEMRSKLVRRKVFLISCALSLAACTNPYSDFYQVENNSFIETKVMPFTGEPSVRQGSGDWESDAQDMNRYGYILLGTADFEAGDVADVQAVAKAKEVGAHVVILNKKYRETRTGTMPLTVPTVNTTYHSGSLYGYGGSARYSGTSTSYGSSTTYIPYAVNRYAYGAQFWAKARPPVFGGFFADVGPEESRALGSNKGVVIVNIVKASPAFDHDILVGDIVTHLNLEPVTGVGNLLSLLERHAGETVTLDIFRNGARTIKTVRLGSGA